MLFRSSYTVGVVQPGNTYGSITAPTTLGSASDGTGGGAAIIHAAGALAINGVVEAHADRNGDTQNQGSAGGSIYLRGHRPQVPAVSMPRDPWATVRAAAAVSP